MKKTIQKCLLKNDKVTKTKNIVARKILSTRAVKKTIIERFIIFYLE